MKTEQVYAEVELKHKDKSIKHKALIDTRTSKSIMSKEVAEKLREADDHPQLGVVTLEILGLVFNPPQKNPATNEEAIKLNIYSIPLEILTSSKLLFQWDIHTRSRGSYSCSSMFHLFVCWSEFS